MAGGTGPDKCQVRERIAEPSSAALIAQHWSLGLLPTFARCRSLPLLNCGIDTR